MIQQYRHIANDKVYSIDTPTEIDESTLTSKSEAELLADGFTLVGEYVEPVIEEPNLSPYTTGINTLTVNTTDVGNIGTDEDNLMTYTLPTHILCTDNDYIYIQAFGTFANTALNTKRVRMYFGSEEIYDSGAQVSGGSWSLSATIIRTGENSQKALVKFHTDTALFTDEVKYVATTQDMTDELVVKCTGQAVATNDVIQTGFIIKYIKNG